MNEVIRFSVLASGSKGNACYLETEGIRILIDAGLSGREIERRLGLRGIEASSLDGIVITHEHLDHIKGVGPLARRYDLPTYLNRKTFENGRKKLGKLPRPIILETGRPLNINGLCVEAFTKCHDAADPVGLVVQQNKVKLGIATDLGRSTRLVEDRLKGCQALILEFNHDSDMLDNGPYPLYLKQRIKSRDGHLSNDQAGELLDSLCHQSLKQVVLAHMSDANNDPDIAYETAKRILHENDLGRVRISIGLQDEPGPMIEIY